MAAMCLKVESTIEHVTRISDDIDYKAVILLPGGKLIRLIKYPDFFWQILNC